MLVKAKSDFYLVPIALSLALIRGHDELIHRSLCCPNSQRALYTSPISVVSKNILLFHSVPIIWVSVALEV